MNNSALQRIQAPGRWIKLRIALGAVAAWLAPSFCIAVGVLVAGELASERPVLDLETAAAMLAFAPLFGLFVGAPTLAVGYLGWWLLHRNGRHGYGAAALLGLVAPLGSIGIVSLLSRNTFSGDGGAIFLGGLILLGAATGLLVRWIAYPNPDGLLNSPSKQA